MCDEFAALWLIICMTAYLLNVHTYIHAPIHIDVYNRLGEMLLSYDSRD